MGLYLNPGNSGFKEIINGIYVDKTGLIDYVSSTIGTSDKLTCFTRPRRFGKSYAAKMLCAYYDKSCDSHALFEGLEISKLPSFEKYLNKYNVICLDMTGFISAADDVKDVVSNLQKEVIAELKSQYCEYVNQEENVLANALVSVSENTGDKFVIIIDEWDALFREAKNDRQLQHEYLMLIRSLFKNTMVTSKAIAAAYMTGILPIKKYGTESALSDFREFSMVDPLSLSEYIGFTEPEVRTLCRNYNLSFDDMKKWYDGYSFSDTKSVYNPNSVMNAVKYRKFKSYWTKTETFESLKNYISMNFDGLRDDIIAMIGGQHVSVKSGGFQNDITSMKNKNDVLTLLVHLGYLAYDELNQTVRIPNLEITDAFEPAIENTDWRGVAEAIRRSNDLLNATIDGDCDMVAKTLEQIHESETSVLRYNNEASLVCAITIAYYSARNFYDIVREMPRGKGFADMVFIPFKGIDKPAMVVELKCDKSADTAITQIKEKRYNGCLKGYSDEIVLVGISYDRETKRHECVIETI